MPAGRPATTGESPQVRFRARSRVADRLTARRLYPDLRNEPFYGGPKPQDGEPPALGTVAARDLATFYDLLDAELATAAAELTRGQAVMILHTVWSLAPDASWVTGAPEMLAVEVESDLTDDETQPGADRARLAALIRSWPRLRAYAVLEACLTMRDGEDTGDLDTAFAKAGLACGDGTGK